MNITEKMENYVENKIQNYECAFEGTQCCNYNCFDCNHGKEMCKQYEEEFWDNMEEI